MFSGTEIARAFEELGITHVIWLPDSATGPWESALDQSPRLSLLRVTREGEAWALAGGLYLGGQRPMIVIQSTGFFESSDSMRNMLFDWKLPLYSIVGVRSYHTAGSQDSAKRLIEPVVSAFGLDYQLIDRSDQLPQLSEHYRACQAAGRAGVTLLAE